MHADEIITLSLTFKREFGIGQLWNSQTGFKLKKKHYSYNQPGPQCPSGR